MDKLKLKRIRIENQTEHLENARDKLQEILNKLVKRELSEEEALEEIFYDNDVRIVFQHYFAEIVRDDVLNTNLPQSVDRHGQIILTYSVIDTITGVISKIKEAIDILKAENGKRYVLSALVMPCSADRFSLICTKIDLETARLWIKAGDFISAVGHESTAKLLSELLGVEIKPNRIFVNMELFDEALTIQFLERIQEGKVLSKEELEELYKQGKIVFRWIKRIL